MVGFDSCNARGMSGRFQSVSCTFTGKPRGEFSAPTALHHYENCRSIVGTYEQGVTVEQIEDDLRAVMG